MDDAAQPLRAGTHRGDFRRDCADAEVQACRARARAAGFEIDVSVEAQVRAVDVAAPRRRSLARPVVPPSRRLLPAARTYDITAADRRFLRSLRISAGETTEPVE